MKEDTDRSMPSSRPLRVLFVESGTELGGAQVALLTMLRNLNRGCLQPYYASLGFGKGNLPDVVECLGIPTFRLPAGRFRDLRQTAAKLRELWRIIGRENIDVVFSNSGHPLLFARPAALWAGCPCVWWVHGYFTHDPLRGHLIPLAEQWLQADTIFANSRHTAQVLSLVFPQRPLARVVNYGIDIHKFRPAPEQGAAARQALGIGPRELVVGMFGRLHPFKGQDVFLKAASLLAARGCHARFLLVGGTPFDLKLSYAEGLRRQAAESGLGERIRFLGQRIDTNELLNACDVVVHASVEPEPWGLVVSEAMAAGRTVVATDGGGPREMIEDGRTGRLVPIGDATALASALESLLHQPELRATMGAAARQHAEEHFEASRAASVLCAELRKAHNAFSNA